jgi:3-oxoacyl-[acyl-carrier-protein] synthase-3
LFGDGAGAAILGPCSDEDKRAGRGILSTHLYTDSTYACSLYIPGGGSKEPSTVEGIAKKRHLVHMEGQDIFKAAVRNLVSASKAALAANDLAPGAIDWVVAHQANLRILKAISDRVEIPMDRFFINIHKYGNTSSASIPIALDELLEERGIEPGKLLLMTALGAGISWGSAVVRW